MRESAGQMAPQEHEDGRLRVAGHPLHTRSLTITVARREDGKWRAHGEVIDLRKCSFAPMFVDLQTPGIIHHMQITVLVDPSTRVLEQLDVAQPTVAFEASAATGGDSCRDPVHLLQALVGEKLGPEFSRQLRLVFGGPRGCSHLLVLFHLMASALTRVFDEEDDLLRAYAVDRMAGETLFRRSMMLDGYEADDHLVRLAVQLSDYHLAPATVAREPIERLARHREARVLGSVDLPSLSLTALEARERLRTYDTLASAAWTDRTSALADLVGRRIMPGLGTELLARFANEPQSRLLLDALLQLAPGFVQCIPAMADRFLSHGLPRNLPQESDFTSLGGAADSCYMWRRGSPLLDARGTAEKRIKGSS